MNWIPEEDEVLRRMWRDGVSSTCIGKKLNRSKNSVIGRADTLNLDTHPLAPKHQVHYKPSSKKLIGLNLIRRAVLQEVYDNGGTLKEAAQRLGLHKDYISRVARRFGIKFSDLPYSRLSPRITIRNKHLEEYDESRKAHLRSLVDLPHNCCKWPIGENPTGFCGAPLGPHVKTCGPYCETHQFHATHPDRRARLFDVRAAA